MFTTNEIILGVIVFVVNILGIYVFHKYLFTPIWNKNKGDKK